MGAGYNFAMIGTGANETMSPVLNNYIGYGPVNQYTPAGSKPGGTPVSIYEATAFTVAQDGFISMIWVNPNGASYILYFHRYLTGTTCW